MAVRFIAHHAGRHFRPRVIKDQRLPHADWIEQPLAHEPREIHSGCRFDERHQHVVTRIAVCETLAGSEIPDSHLTEKHQCVGVGWQTGRSIDDVVVFRQSAGVRHEMANRQPFVRCEFRQPATDGIVVAERVAFRQQDDRHRRELLRHGREPERGGRRNRHTVRDVGIAVACLVHDPSVPDHHDRRPWLQARCERRE